jgi:hypothetical protein
MIFFTGMHHPHNAGKVPAAFISVNAIRNRKSDFPVGDWILDSGAFTIIKTHGDYPDPPSAYAAQIKRWSKTGNLLAAVAQDYMCEEHMLKITGKTIAEHQRLTIERYDELLKCDTGAVYIMPVLQGYAPEDYVSHIRQYGDRLKPGMWVGVGSVCKRNSNPESIVAVLLAIKAERPDLNLHGFGVKVFALALQLVRDLLYSADSMAWSFAARYEGRDANDPAEAIRYAKRIARMPTQLYFPGCH